MYNSQSVRETSEPSEASRRPRMPRRLRSPVGFKRPQPNALLSTEVKSLEVTNTLKIARTVSRNHQKCNNLVKQVRTQPTKPLER